MKSDKQVPSIRHYRAQVIEAFTNMLDGEIASAEKSGRDPVNAYITLRTTDGSRSETKSDRHLDLCHFSPNNVARVAQAKPRSSRR